MSFTPEFSEFYSRWSTKARCYQDGLQQCFDKFFTLYVLFNRLYTEATFRLGTRGHIKMSDRQTFPDAKAAQEYVVKYVGARSLLEKLGSSPECQEALEQIRERVCEGSFSFKLGALTGDPQPDLDRDLCKRLTGASSNAKARAVLETLYALRCNMFHGRKGYHPDQLEILRPANVILARVNEVLYEALERDGG